MQRACRGFFYVLNVFFLLSLPCPCLPSASLLVACTCLGRRGGIARVGKDDGHRAGACLCEYRQGGRGDDLLLGLGSLVRARGVGRRRGGLDGCDPSHPIHPVSPEAGSYHGRCEGKRKRTVADVLVVVRVVVVATSARGAEAAHVKACAKN